jgi:hypothetical protein
MDQRADRAMVVREAFATGWIGRRVEIVGRRLRVGERARACRRRRDALEMHVAERNRELERQRKQRQIRTRSFTRPEPTHRRHASRVSRRGRTILPVRACRFSNNVTLPRFGQSGGSVAIHLVCCRKSTLQGPVSTRSHCRARDRTDVYCCICSRQLVAQSGRPKTSARLSAFGAKRTYPAVSSRSCPTRMTHSGHKRLEIPQCNGC